MSAINNWMESLLQWADTHNIPHTILPREEEALLNLTALNLSSPDLYSRTDNTEEVLESIAVQLDGEKPKPFTIPEEIGYLQNLKHLEVNLRELKYLPRSIGELTNLEFLNVAYNDLKGLPYEIENLTNLKSIDLRGNDLTISEDQEHWLHRSVKSVLHDLMRITCHDLADNKMDQWGIKNEYVRKPQKCPACKQERVAPILYGYPTPEAFESGKYFIGGCTIVLDRKQYYWGCLDCGFRLYKNHNIFSIKALI
jgi:Leucine-rich repeat (LRR) protein